MNPKNQNENTDTDDRGMVLEGRGWELDKVSEED